MKEQDIEDFSESRQHCDIMFLTLKNENKRYRGVKKKKKENKDSPTNPGQIYILGKILTGTHIPGKLL